MIKIAFNFKIDSNTVYISTYFYKNVCKHKSLYLQVTFNRSQLFFWIDCHNI